MSMEPLFTLAEDVLVFPVSDLEPTVQAQAASKPGDFIVTRPNARETSTLLDQNGVALIESFRQARSVVDAVIHFSSARGLDPHQVLDEAYPLIRQMVTANFLVPADSAQAQRIMPTLNPGDTVAGWTVEQSVHLVDDTEVYRMRDGAQRSAALKIARPEREAPLRAMLHREAALLSRAGETAAPRLIASDDHNGRPFLLLEWCDGAPVLSLARQLEREASPDETSRLLKICVAVLRAYADLHARGIVHGDVHPGNILATEQGDVRILDFGRALVAAEHGPLGSAPRGGASFYFDPQFAKATLEGKLPPAADMPAEQYSLAVLLRHLLVGRPYIDFSLQRELMLRQIVEERPVPFIRHGAMPWPDVERVLGKALAKSPADRFASVAEFAAELSRAGARTVPTIAARGDASDFLAGVLRRYGIDSDAYRALENPAALCSVNTGAAGIAYALCRIASMREDSALLALAEIWIARAECNSSNERAVYCEEYDLTPASIGRTSLFHTSVGVSCVEALIGVALGDGARIGQAIKRFLARAEGESISLDLALGRAGLLLGCAVLFAALPAETAAGNARTAIAALGDRIDGEIRRKLAGLPPLGEGGELNLGIAHGWGGALFALLRWREACRRGGPDAALEIYLRALAAHAEPAGDGLRWRWMTGRPDVKEYMPGWCNGTAGLAQLWTLAERSFADENYAELAHRAALNAWQEPSNLGDLCCGAAGRSYAMLNLYRQTGDAVWLGRAHDLANRAVASIQQRSMKRDSLYKGETGVALLIADLERPELSCMPLFDAEP
jgi:eukaryotic-like serine/threonine-protein kinase